MKCETVKIKTDNGVVTINKSDLDKKIHTLAAEKTEPKKTTSKKSSKPK